MPVVGAWIKRFWLIEWAPETDPPTDEELAAMKMTRSQAYDLMARLKARQEATIRNTGKASYRIVLESKRTTHADFTDLPVLQSRDRAQAETRVRVLGVVLNYTRAFFDKNLRGMKSPLLDDNVVSEFVETVQKFEPPKRLRRGR